MSKAYKCDRCGKYYCVIQYRHIISISSCGTNSELNDEIVSGVKVKHADLCPECAKSFTEWFKDGSEVMRQNDAAVKAAQEVLKEGNYI